MAHQTNAIEINMEHVDIPGTKLAPTRIALGTWAIGGWMWGGSDDQESIRTIHSALDRGITIIDTAPVYGFGHSEEIVGKALAESGMRQNVTIATKVGLDWRDGQPFRNGSKARIKKEIDDSLRRLRTDVIDIYQVHWPDLNTPIEETAQALGELHRAGKIRAIGVSNFSPAQMDGCALGREFNKTRITKVLHWPLPALPTGPNRVIGACSPIYLARKHAT